MQDKPLSQKEVDDESPEEEEDEDELNMRPQSQPQPLKTLKKPKT